MKLLSSILAGAGVAFGFVPHCDGAVQTHNLDDLIDAIAEVESGGDPNAYEVVENAAGLYQIRPIYLADVNRILGYQKFKLSDRYNPNKARQMVWVYLLHYGKGKSFTDMAVMHCAGYKGWKRYKKHGSKQIDTYVAKIMAELEKR